MTKNTYKTNSSKAKQKKRFRLPVVSLAFLEDKRFKLSVGLFLLFSSIYLTIAFFSYLFTGKADQSVVESIHQSNPIYTAEEAKNWLGLIGAVLSHYFIYKWFGIASFLFTPILFFIGTKIVFKKVLLPIKRFTQFAGFSILWLSLLLGYFILVTKEVTALSFVSGGIGFELSSLLNSMMGWGTPLLLICILLVFSIYFFNITSFLPRPVVDIAGDTDQGIVIQRDDVVVGDTHLQENTTIVSDSNTKQELVLTSDNHVLSKEDKLIQKENDLEIQIVNSTEEQNDLKKEFSSEPENSIKEKYNPTLDLSSYKYPTLDLLDDYTTGKGQVTKEELEANKDKIVETLSHYGIGIGSIKATIGPTVTLYEIVPDAGVRISKIKSLEDDIALSLAALGIRIIAPIPGKGTIGIEVPNKNRELVSIKSILASERFSKNDYELPIVFGKTISNEVYISDLTKMPHLLIAGATGQGKSVGINVLVASLIYHKHPSQLKFVLVDPKKVELSLFTKLERHFLAKLPNNEEAIITETKKVVHTLNSLCLEMEIRYNLLKEAGCRNIKEYNKKFVERRLSPEKGHQFLPYIVLIIDELADLMMVSGKEVEQPIARLAQLARAIGIHLVVATQRPSVNVITGIIKANFPVRLSFKVTSKIDSRTILDTGGADQLVGQGDMLLSSGSDIIRLQCAFIDTPEVERICEFIGSQRGYPSAYLLPEYDDEQAEVKEGIDLENRDSLFEEAARLIVTHQQGSTSLIQRRMKLGYNRAGRLIDQLEAAGIVGPFEGSKAREVLVPDIQTLEKLLQDLNTKNKLN
jgi:S-DNA-T family DNA segregation ATPase FtsK/SpoIIIE